MEYKKDEILIKSSIEKIKKGNATRFLNSKESYFLESTLRKNKILYHLYKPFETSNSCIFYKEKLPNVSMIKTANKNFKHGDILGSYFTLGLDKSIIGDIVIKDDFVYIIVLEEYEQLLIEQFVSIKNEYVSFERTEWVSLEYQYEDLSILATSNRMDCIISKLLKLSRSQTNELFSKKEVMLNYDVAVNSVKGK